MALISVQAVVINDDDGRDGEDITMEEKSKIGFCYREQRRNSRRIFHKKRNGNMAHVLVNIGWSIKVGGGGLVKARILHENMVMVVVVLL